MTVLLPLPGHEGLAAALASRHAGELGVLEAGRFPDGESHVRIATEVSGRDVAICATLRDPDPQVVPLLLAADAARELGARRVVLVAPYLAYLRQDARFRPGEAVSARSFGRLLSGAVDGLVTVDPHLHRLSSLSEVFTVPALALSAARLLAAWIGREIERPLVVGPDEESRQWAARVAAEAGCPHVVLRKVRHDAHRVEVAGDGLAEHGGRTPVVVDDVVSTGGTVVETLLRLRESGLEGPVVLAVHGIFATNAVPLAGLLANGLGELLAR
jgi:ribose-phosphate pyrophosphokinase